MWSEDGFVLRFPETEDAPAIDPILLEPEEAAELVLRGLVLGLNLLCLLADLGDTLAGLAVCRAIR